MPDNPDPGIFADLPATLEEMHGDDDPVAVALDYVKGVLLGRIADPTQRWAAVTRFANDLPAALEHVRALTIAQLVQGGMSVEDAGDAVGVNRQRAHALLNRHDQPTPRQLKARPVDQEPGHRLGVFLGVASLIAERLDVLNPSLKAQDQLEKLTTAVHLTPRAAVARIHAEIARWTRRNARDSRLSQLLPELEHSSALLDDLPTFLAPPQQCQMWIARSSTCIRLAQ